MLARLPEGAPGCFDAYESTVLPLLAEYGGNLERRLRTLNDRVEAHLVSFPATKTLLRTGPIVVAVLLRRYWNRLGQYLDYCQRARSPDGVDCDIRACWEVITTR
jgi:hypothetical protein